MPNYTTSYSKKKKPHYRRVKRGSNDQLPSARARTQRRRGGMYLRHSQGFGAKGGGGYGYGSRNKRRPYALIIVGCAFLLFAASIVWYANRGVGIKLNGEDSTVRINSSIEQLITDKALDLKAGNLLAVDDSVMERGGGERCSVKLNGKEVPLDELDTIELTGGEELEIGNGADVYEKHDVQATTIQPTLSVEGTGAVQYVKTWGVPGRSEIWTGHVSGKTVDKGVVVEPVNAVVKCANVLPSDKKEKYIALTFDEAPSAQTTEILRILKEKGAAATFFVSGDKVEQYASTVKAIADAGCEIGTNAYTDTSLSDLSDEELRQQITSSFDAVKKAAGVDTALLRPPYAQFTAADWARAMDLVGAVVNWNIDSGDWLMKGSQTVIDTVTESAVNGNIVLLNDNDTTSQQVVEALPQIIDKLQADGYKLVTLSELIKTDKDLADEVSLSKVSMPKDAVLPQLPADGDGQAE